MTFLGRTGETDQDKGGFLKEEDGRSTVPTEGKIVIPREIKNNVLIATVPTKEGKADKQELIEVKRKADKQLKLMEVVCPLA